MIRLVGMTCARVRRWVEPRWGEWRDLIHPRCELPLPAGLCGPAAILLREALAVAVPAVAWFSTGGENDPTEWEARGGMVPLDGWRPVAHSWVEGVLPDGGGLIADITADQFGYGRVVVADAGDRRYWRTYRLVEIPDGRLCSDTIGLAWAADYALSRDGADASVRVHTGPVIDALREERARFHAMRP